MEDDRDKRVFVDENGVEHYMDSSGVVHYGMPSLTSKRNSKKGEFVTYDSSKGHCGLCGSINCRGGCFK